MAKYKTINDTSSMSRCKICKSAETKLKHSKDRYRYFQCKKCLTLFLSPIPSARILNMYYQKVFEYTAGIAEEKRIAKMAHHVMNSLVNLHHDGQNLLDIGSGYGVFLGEAKKHLSDVIGIEPSKSLYNYSKSYIKQHIKNINFEEFLKENKKKYDFITLIHVIEHLLNPKKTLKQIISLLKPNGILYIETPNIDSHLYYAEQESYTFLTPPDHIFLFSQYSFKEMLKDFKDIHIERLSTYSFPEHFMGIIKRQMSFLRKQESRLNRFPIKSGMTKMNKQNIKYLLLDKLIAPLFTPLLNIGNKGSILELYIRKIS